MLKRMILMLTLTVVVIVGLGAVKYRQIQGAAAQAAAMQPPPEAVTTIVAQSEDWPDTLAVIGTTAAVQGVTVAADLPGLVSRISFESGRAVKEGDVLVELDTRQEQAQLAAAEAQRELARLNFERMQALVVDGAISKADFDQAAAEQKSTDARVGEIKASIARKTIRAPFTGILGIRQVNLGQYVAGGTPVVPLQALHPIYVNFGVPQQETSRVHVGRSVRITADELSGVTFTGRVTAVDSVIDKDTRNIQVQATVPNPDGRLRPGMFVQTAIVTGASRSNISLPASSIGYAPFGDSVYVLADLKGPDGRTYRESASSSSSWGRRAATASRCSPASTPGTRSSRLACSSSATARR